ncbi:hypothetical protein PHLGIDRAFT_324735 [Phlebiopsis gigantea 11061_1 CR5-6]|uniref:Uncharacterized protein n=1 Tax=Phlebiopsis gigantea (strain 11061_1 CR5-6) TaxID=745531 RepID=A0A0C3NBN3_PHLG1|nr:hypothetical protein PHLGIDRAFT_324735 [Phlebiopsis gigantea 11061_1 CR5-6]
MSSPIKVDDSNPSIGFFGSWVLGGSTHEYNGTTHGALTNGSGFNFNFTGVSVSVVATVAITPAGGLTDVVTFNLDDLEAVIVAAPQTGAAIYNYNYFTSPTTLENGNHQLVVTGIRIGGPDISGFWFDYLEYFPGAVSTTRAPAPSSETSVTISSVRSESASNDPLLPTTAISPPTTASSVVLSPSSTAPKTIPGSSSSSTTNTSSAALAATAQNSTSVGSLPSSTAASSSSSSTIPSPNALDGNQRSANNNRHIIPAIVVSVCAFAVLVAGALWFLHYKKRRAYSAALADHAAPRLDGDAQGQSCVFPDSHS